MWQCVGKVCASVLFLFTSLDATSHHQALEEALNLHPPAATQPPPGQGNHGDAASNLKKQELLTQVAVLKEQVRGGNIAAQTPSAAPAPPAGPRVHAVPWFNPGVFSLHSR